ncbi:uncharacterized protein [Taeniopygia guttata]|uniref:uncharacterized protein n=1 Tax=Taeniopygia guttata TaxID=59729 RepID=UPI003BB99DBB
MGIGGMKRVKGSSTGKDREDREQVNSPKQCPVRLRTKAHREKRGERRGRSRAWDGWGGQSRGRLGHREGCGRTGPRSESCRGGTERLGQAPRRPSHAGAAVTGEGRGGREGAGSPAVVGELLRGRDGQRGAPAPRRGRCVLSAQLAASPLRPGPRLRGRIHERPGQPPPPPPRSRAGSAPGRRKAGGRAGPDRPFPRSPRRDSVPGPAPPPSRPAGPGRAGPGLAATQRRGLPALTSIARPAESGPRPPAPSASAGPGSAAAAASPRRGPGIAEAPPLAAAPPRLTAGGEPGLRLPAPAGPGGAGPRPRPAAEPARPHEPLGGGGRPTAIPLACPRGRCSDPSPG